MGWHDDLVGEEFGRLSVVERAKEKDKYGRRLWRVRCQCGKESTVPTGSLTSGRSRSCGCLRAENNSARIGPINDAYKQRKIEAAKKVRLTGKQNCCRTSCQEQNPQPLSRFRKRKSSLSGMRSICKTCEDSDTINSKTGITGARKRKEIELQGGKCANQGCDRPATHADHNHETGRFRAILCMPCNSAEGLLKDLDRIRGLLEYRLRHDAIDYPEKKTA